MDDGRIEKMMQKREKRYMWLERKLKINLAVTTAVVTAFFLMVLYFSDNWLKGYWAVLFCAALLLNGSWCVLSYRREYQSYSAVCEYLEAFEKGEYTFQLDKDYMRPGIHSQIMEQLERLGHAFQLSRNRLEEEKKKTQEMVTDISHQVKTPVAALLLSFELMSDEDTTPEEKQEFLERGEGEARKLGCLMETLTNLSRLEQDMISLKRERASLRQTLVRAVNGVYMKAGEKQIEIEMKEFEDIKIVHDVRWTAEAFANVIDNAVKYSPEHTKIHIQAESYYSYVSVSVEDEGIGVAKQEYTKIFQRFYRGKSAEVEAQEGAGVGLYLVRKILEEQGGSVRVQSVPGGGSIFQMLIPKEYVP